ncbi:energy transducer TonB [Psychrobacter piscatorii]|uniref:Energy transducer TonB n=1 Tax=Psychrobacter piscatorii TaxID=554343 RepID=A0A0T6DTM1_9GAMM|nr:energy transducer TonB [Psychrobacter piscatorii]KRU23114.1 energy transducer TonB [Psychrobacter piscatorii]
MSSTDLEAPPIRSILLSILIVVGLHLLTAVALVSIKAPKLQPEPKQDIPPIEIEFVTLPTKSAAPIAETKEPVQQVKKVTVKKEVQPKPVQKPKAEPPPKKRVETPIEPAKPVVKKVSETPPIIATEKTSTESSQKPVPKEAAPKKISPEPIVDTSAADEQRKEAAARAKKAAQEAQDRAAQEAKRVADAKAAAQAKAAREAEAAAQAQAAREAAEAAAEAAARAQSNEPVSFTASAANWASAPNFSFPDRAARRARSGDTLNVVLVLRVNKQGGIDSVRVAQSSGNTLLDKEAQRQVRSGKFKPFTKNGAPVVGNVTLPISYAVP